MVVAPVLVVVAVLVVEMIVVVVMEMVVIWAGGTAVMDALYAAKRESTKAILSERSQNLSLLSLVSHLRG